ncbi:hypothetical protein ABK249_14020 [Neorhizobium sp. Rsf11]|uniref:Uncharacterized protein n=2 Tax=Neorhizobium TaxID=1525371 RepID=A0ABV0M3P7_9HYPH|nr:hypothetical protein [Neorhizobium petrolearium]MCC2612133.1 hypothetical protein [Neorhizobium petrolearium]WGI67286.1 hypothetical protein QEO92_20085 [Neorhizobium petrolearium]
MAMQSSSKTSIFQRFDNYQPSKTILVWTCVVTAVATMIIGFTWGGWVTGGTSRTAEATAVENARGELASAICVERFNAAPDASAKLTEFKAMTDGYARRQFIEAGGWATMPGQTTPNRLGVQGCTTALAG